VKQEAQSTGSPQEKSRDIKWWYSQMNGNTNVKWVKLMMPIDDVKGRIWFWNRFVHILQIFDVVPQHQLSTIKCQEVAAGSTV